MGLSPHQPFQSGFSRFSFGPYMLLPIMKAPASVNAFLSAWCFSGSSNIQWWRKSSGMSPKGFSKLWLGPATKASNDIEIELVTLFMRFSPLGDHLNSVKYPMRERRGFYAIARVGC